MAIPVVHPCLRIVMPVTAMDCVIVRAFGSYFDIHTSFSA